MAVAAVVGGCGFLGRHISDKLAQTGFEVLSIHRSEPHSDVPPGVTCVSQDYRDVTAMREVLRPADALFHLGSQSVPRTSVSLGVAGILTEVEANSLLFDLAAGVGVETVVFASSGGSVYGDCTPGRLIGEDHSTRPISPHGLLKIMTELVLSQVSQRSGQRAVSLRPGNVYGPGQRQQPGFGVVPTFMSNLAAGRPSEIWGPEVVRDYIYIEDVAEAFVRAGTVSRDLPEALNIGTGVGHTAIEIYGILQGRMGTSMPIGVVPRPESDPRWSVLDPVRSTEVLGEYAVTPLASGLRRTVDLMYPSHSGKES